MNIQSRDLAGCRKVGNLIDSVPVRWALNSSIWISFPESLKMQIYLAYAASRPPLDSIVAIPQGAY